MASPDPWAEVRAWRVRTRDELVQRRREAGDDVRRQVAARVGRVLDAAVNAGPPAPVIAFYWPIRGEVALFEPMRRALDRGATAALPVVVAPDRALEFRRWTPSCRMTTGVWRIPVPADGEPVTPTLLLVPVVGFDAGCHRLGNGGGYYDRTLAALGGSALAVGVGMECLRLPTIHPQAHDVPMDLVVTERQPEDGSPLPSPPHRRCASPPCALDELPPDRRGF